MAATATKEVESKWSWRGLVERLATKRTKAISDYAELVDRLAGGEEITDAQVEAALNKAAKSPFDLERDVATKAERVAWCAEIERLQAVVSDGEAAEAEEQVAITAHNAAIEKMVGDLRAKLSPLQARKLASGSAKAQIENLRHKLVTGCPDHLLAQQNAIMQELREAVTALQRQDDYLSEWRTTWRRQIDEADESPEGRQLADATKSSLTEQQRQRDDLARRVADLQGQMDEIEAAKVRP